MSSPSIQGIGHRSVFLSDRLVAFVKEHRAKGFSDAQVLRLAQMHYDLDRGSVRVVRLGGSCLMRWQDSARQNLAKALAAVQTPEQLESFQKNLTQSWWGGEKTDCQQVLKFQRILHPAEFQQRLESWAHPASELAEGVDLAEALLPLFTRKELDIPPGVPGADLKEVVRRTGLHTFSYSSWLYGPADLPWLAHQLDTMNGALERFTGWEGPVLGLGGWGTLHLDDAFSEAGGVTEVSMATTGNRPAKSFVGRSFIRLGQGMGWGALTHEWVHSLDALVGLHHLGRPELASTKLPWVQEWVEKMEATPLGQTPENVRNWLAQHEQDLEQGKGLKMPGKFEDLFFRWAGIHEKAMAGEPIENVHMAFRTHFPSDYLGSWQERLAYASNRACLAMEGVLPYDTVLAPVMFGTPAERQVAADGFRRFLASPQMQECWARAQLPLHEGSLLDEVSKRRHRQALERKQEKPTRKPLLTL